MVVAERRGRPVIIAGNRCGDLSHDVHTVTEELSSGEILSKFSLNN
jgi:hypothetical protein